MPKSRSEAHENAKANLHTRIERDRRHAWHPVVEIRERGAVVFAITSVRGWWHPERAALEAVNEAKRVEKLGQ